VATDITHEVSVIEGKPTLKEIDATIIKPMDEMPNVKFFIAIGFTLTLLLIGVVSLGMAFYRGLGLWGVNNPVGWGFAIINFVFWVGIGHAGTLISAILFLFRQKWRTGIARFAEGMTIFAVMTAGLFPLLHVGRPWLDGYLMPHPNQHNLWVNFTSPLLWDVFAVSTYFTVSFVFWYMGLVPDFATMRDRLKNSTVVSKLKKAIYSVLSLGWRFSNRHWSHYEMMYLVLAGFATPLVLSVHTIVSFDFAVSIVTPYLSDDTFFMYSVSCKGWLLFGNLKKITIIDTTVATEASNTVISKVTGINAGNGKVGLPPIFIG
jgi:molybdopterin-containing oxidoreductase family membrane subunit